MPLARRAARAPPSGRRRSGLGIALSRAPNAGRLADHLDRNAEVQVTPCPVRGQGRPPELTRKREAGAIAERQPAAPGGRQERSGRVGELRIERSDIEIESGDPFANHADGNLLPYELRDDFGEV